MATRTIHKGETTFRVASGAELESFWDWYESTWEPDTVAIFERFLRPDTVYVDLGAWVGPTVLLAAPRVSRVVCVEPDPLARDALERNLALNPEIARKVAVHGFAVGSADGVARLSSREAGGDSNSTLLPVADAAAAWSVPVVGVETFAALPDVREADFLKIDVEGSEYAVIPAMRDFLMGRRPSVYLATHPNLLLDKSSLPARIRSAARALYLNWRMLRTLLPYRHHYVYDDATRRLEDVRRRNLARVVLPLPLRSSFLIGSCLFTDEEVQGASR